MKTILYIHGFNSAGNGAKAEALKTAYPKLKVVSPTFAYKDIGSVLKQINSTFITSRPNLVIGTSLGGFFALYCGCKYRIPCISINPTTKPSETLRNMLGENKNFVTKERYIITEQDLGKYKKFEDEVFTELSPADNQTAFILSNDDELLGDHHYLEELYPQCHNFQYFDGQGHRFTSIKPIKAQIDRFLS